jgi:hypothetical protein
MSIECPFCAPSISAKTLACRSCGYDVAVPESLIAERDELIHERKQVREELSCAKSELEFFGRRSAFLQRSSVSFACLR